jgi:hypothetical protein
MMKIGLLGRPRPRGPAVVPALDQQHMLGTARAQAGTADISVAWMTRRQVAHERKILLMQVTEVENAGTAPLVRRF